MHNYKLGDSVRHSVDRAPFEVVGIRKDKIEIEGDFSGGTHNVTQRDWVPVEEIELFNPKQPSEAKVKFYEYGQSLGIKINDLQRLMVLAKSSDVELEPIVPPTIIFKEELKERLEKEILSGTKEFALYHEIHYDESTENMILNAIREVELSHKEDEEELDIYRNLLINLHTCRWTGNDKKVIEILDKIGAYSYARTNSNAGCEEHEKELRQKTLKNLKTL